MTGCVKFLVELNKAQWKVSGKEAWAEALVGGVAHWIIGPGVPGLGLGVCGGVLEAPPTDGIDAVGETGSPPSNSEAVLPSGSTSGPIVGPGTVSKH